jgi:hypothetical protein
VPPVLLAHVLPTAAQPETGKTAEARPANLPDLHAYETHVLACLALERDEPAEQVWREKVQRQPDKAQSVHQRAIEASLDLDEAGACQQFPDLAGAWLGLVNAGGPVADPRRAANTTEVVRSIMDIWLHGRPVVAAARTREGLGEMRRLPADSGGIAKLEAALRVQGHGACAIMVQEWPHGERHASTVHNQGGEIVYVDAQRIHQRLSSEPVPGAVRLEAQAYGPEGQYIDLAR